MKFQPLTLTIEVKTQEQYDALKAILAGAAEGPAAGPATAAAFRPADESKQARVRISGQQIAIGNRSNMQLRFDQERAMHPNARIVLEEMINGNWSIVSGTRRQQVTRL